MPIADALRLLQQLHRRRNYRPVADTIGRLLAETRAHVGFILRPAGEQALANVLHVAELARQYEAGGGISFRGFIDELRDRGRVRGGRSADPRREQRRRAADDRPQGQGPRVPRRHPRRPDVPAEPRATRAATSMPERGLCAMKIGGWAPHELHEHEAEEVARDQAEGVRLAYVAATRARDLLVVPALGDEPWEGGWFGPLNRALYPPLRVAPQRGARAEVSGVQVEGLGAAAAERRDRRARRRCARAQHAFADGGYSVVWWDPAGGG